MEITEKEREMLVGKKEEIRKLTEEIIDLSIDQVKNEIEIKKRITGIFSLISTIASYAKPKDYDFNRLNLMVNTANHTNFRFLLEAFCNDVNSITFDFTKKGLKITLPKNLNIGNITNK